MTDASVALCPVASARSIRDLAPLLCEAVHTAEFFLAARGPNIFYRVARTSRNFAGRRGARGNGNIESCRSLNGRMFLATRPAMIRKLKSGHYRLYSRKKNPKTGRRRNLGTFASRKAAEKHERAVQFFKRG
jgi:hypothetical protein